MKTYITIVILFFTLKIFSQGELNNEARVVSGNEKSYSILFNSNGFGVNYRYGKRITGFKKNIFDFDLFYVKHAKEIKIQNPQYESQKRFVFGKLNSLFTFNIGTGIQKEIYSKFDKGGIAIKYFYEGGVSLALLKPIYYQVVDSQSPNPNDPYISDKKFDQDIHSPLDIYGRSSFFKGFGQTKFIPGIFIKAGLSFVYSNKYEAINAIEAGFITSLFLKPLEIMAIKNNQQYIISIFVSYRFGRVGLKQKENFVPDSQ